VLFVTINMELGGTERQLCALAAGLDRRRFAPRVCCLRGGGPLADTLAAAGVPLTVLAPRARGRAGRTRPFRVFLPQILSLSKLMRRERIAIVHGLLPAALVTAGFAARRARVPVLVTGRRGLGRYKEGRPLLRFLENLVNRWADAVVPNSEAVLRDVLARERILPERLRVIYNGVRIPDASPRAGRREILGAEIRGPVVCLVANLFPYKGHLDFLDAAGEVLRKVPETRFVLVGDGRIRPEIERRASEPDLRGRAILLGSRPDSGEIMACADVLALASHQEGFPNVVLEAMARAKPVVATRVGGVPEAVEEGITGLLVPPRDPPAMAAALVRLIGNPGEAAEMGRRGLARVRELFSIDRMVRAHEGLYGELLERKAVSYKR
jgi:glycosyltransferase involved in cell wall biosynthesis